MSNNPLEDRNRAEGVQPERGTIKDRNRRIFATLLGVGGVAGTAQWSKPIISAVTLPAHAATTFPALQSTGGNTPPTTPPPTTTKIFPEG